MQGCGDAKTPLISSMIELLGKVLIAFYLVSQIGYWGVIIAEHIVWFAMVIPLLRIYLMLEVQKAVTGA